MARAPSVRAGLAIAREARALPRLEKLRQGHVPDAPPNIGLPLVVVIFKVSSRSSEWRIQVEYVVDAKRDGGVIKPGAPLTWIVLRGRDRSDVLVFAVFHVGVLTFVFGIAGELVLCCRSGQVKSVVDDQVQRRPFTDFPIISVP